MTSTPLQAGSALAVAVRLGSRRPGATAAGVAAAHRTGLKGFRTRDLAPALGITEGTVSHHLKQLLQTGLVTKRRKGASIYYGIEVAALHALAAVLAVDGH